jgi:hypothetical protein
LEQNQAFKQKIDGANNTTIQSIGQAISLFESKQKGYSSKAEHAKNVDTNPFRQLNEAPMGWAAIKNLFSGGTQQLVGGTKETADFIKQRDLEGEQYKQEQLAKMAAEEDEEEEIPDFNFDPKKDTNYINMVPQDETSQKNSSENGTQKKRDRKLFFK